MGRHVRIVRGAGIRSAIHALKAEHRAERQRFPAIERYLRDHRPEAWLKVRDCRTRARVVPHASKPDTYKIRLYGCHVEPWCFACVREAKHRRANKAFDRFHKCTPAGQQPRFAHIVQTAMIRHDSTGWGVAAMKDLQAFRDIIMRVVAESYGAGYGAYVSYHPFGERAFAKWHPHLDFTLNGWSLGPDGADQTRPYDLKNGGHDLWAQRTRQHAGARFLVHTDDIVTNLNIQHFVVGEPAYFAALLYQVRELVDVRKMDYDRQRQLVYWLNYKENRREKMTLLQFHGGLAEYQSTFGEWGNYQARRLHVGMGHLADHRLDATQEAMGGQERKHGRACRCARCDDWGDPIFPGEDGASTFNPWTKTD